MKVSTRPSSGMFKLSVNTKDDWRELSETSKNQGVRVIIDLIIKKVKHEDIYSATGVSRHVITALAEINGLARKGRYKGKTPAVIPNPLRTDIDALPDSEVLMYSRNVNNEDAGINDIDENNADNLDKEIFAVTETKNTALATIITESLSDIKKDVLPLLKQLIKLHLGSTLQEVKFITDDGEITYKVR